MALTKISGDVIQSGINIGIVTATRIDGDINGNVNSVGVSTFSTLKVGTIGATSLNASGIATFAGLNILSDDISEFTQSGIVTSGRTYSTYFGTSSQLSGDGNILFVGAPFDENIGAVYVFERSGDTFNRIGIISCSDIGNSNDSFGASVATNIDGTTLAIGAPSDFYQGFDVGLVYVYDRVGNSFNQVGVLTTNDDLSRYDYFGGSLAVSDDGNSIFVGARAADPSENFNVGSVHVFDRVGVGTTSTFSRVGVLTAVTQPNQNDDFGGSIAISADASKIFVGAYQDEYSGSTNGGSVYVFDRVGVGTSSTFNEIAILTPGEDYRRSEELFGYSVATNLEGSSVIVGARSSSFIGPTEHGRVYIFDRVGISSTFNLVGILTSGVNEGNLFGYSVATSSDSKIIVIGAGNDDVAGSDKGAAYIFNRQGNSFNQIGILTAVNAGEFGESVSISDDGTVVVVGDSYGSVGGNSWGNVHIFTAITGKVVYSNGNFGIGTTNPTQKLDVRGNVRITDILTVGTSNSNLTLNGATNQINGVVISSGVVTATTFSGNLTGNVTGNATGLSGTPNINVGAITASSATITGNVSVAGTVTYEDTTNVDSIGVVTARSGLQVTGGSVGVLTSNPRATVQVGTSVSQSVFITSTGLVGLGSTAPRVSLDASQETDAFALPQGTTAQRPSGNSPYIRYNTTNSALEFYNGTDWVEIISDYFPSGSTILG